MRTPTIPGRRQEVVVYPDASKGDYHAVFEGGERDFSTGDIVRIPFDGNRSRPLAFTRKDEILPTRIVRGLRLHGPDGTIPAECSLGIVHASRPPKGSAWMVVSREFDSHVCWVDYAEIYGDCPDDATWDCKLYPANRKEPYEAQLRYGDLNAEVSPSLEDMFGPIDLGGEFAYLSLRSSYGGLVFFSTMQKDASLTIEHAFLTRQVAPTFPLF